MVCKDTLRIKYLPKELSEAQKEDFMKHFGALKVKVITSKAKAKSVVYAKFENEEIAKNVMFRLHQINVLNCRLCVEYAETDILQGVLNVKRVDDLQNVPNQKFFKTFISKINAFNDSVGFHQPPPSHLKYNYPKTNRPTINNIAHALATVPRFYTQVLHLMNKMNLPPPFAMPNPPVRTIQPSQCLAPQKPPDQTSTKDAESSSESEMESDGESNKIKDIIPQKRVLPQKKTVKRPKFIKQVLGQAAVTSNKTQEKHENVFEKVEVVPQKKIELKLNPNTLEEKKELPTQVPLKNMPNVIKVVEKSNEKISLSSKALDTLISKPLKSQSLEKKAELQKKTGSYVDQSESEKSGKVSPFVQHVTERGEDFKPTEKLTDDVTPYQEPDVLKRTESISSLCDNEMSTEVQMDVEVKNTIIQSEEVVTEICEEVTKEPIQEQKVSQEEQFEKSHENMEIDSSQLQPDLDEDIQEPNSPEDEYPCISMEELAANQITDLSVVPVFKNYNLGPPTNKLYIKNCAKTVVLQDLEYIYNRYREERSEDKPTEFNIRLMQEGRMKGQAFVTLDSIKMAQKAVKETNGFILKDKPLVVAFGRAGTKK